MIKLLCDKRVDNEKIYINNGVINNGYEIKGCGATLEIDPSRGNVFARKAKDPVGDDYLSFYWVCPECRMIHPLDQKLLTYEEKLMVMQRDAGIADELYKYYLYKKVIRDLEIETFELDMLLTSEEDKIIRAKENKTRDTSKLYPGWEESSVILKRKIY